MSLSPGMAQAPAAEAPPDKVAVTGPDRSGEAFLRQVFQAHAGLSGVRILLRMDTRSQASAPYLYSRAAELWVDQGNRFRLETVVAFGNGNRVICDGKTVLLDPLSLVQPVVLADAGPNLWDATEALSAARITPLIWLAEGEKGVDRLIVPETFIREVPAPKGLRRVQMGLAQIGVTEFTMRADDPNLRVIQIEWDSNAEWRATVRGGNASVEMGGSRTLNSIIWAQRGAKFNANLFDATVPKGLTSTDRRKAAAKPTPPETDLTEKTRTPITGDGSPVTP